MTEIEHSEYLKEVEHQYAVRGDTESIGRIRTSNHQDGNSIKSHIQKRTKHERDLRHILDVQTAVQHFNDILDQMKIHLDELEELKRQSILAQQLIQNGDIEGSIEFLIQYHNLRANDLSLMSDSEIMAVMMNIEGQNQDNIERLKSEIKTLAHEAYLIMGKHFDTNNPEHQKLMNRLEDMESRAKNLNTDFDKVLEHAHFETGNTYTLLKAKMNKNSKTDVFQNPEKISDKFNMQALGDSDLNKQREQELQSQTTQKTIGMNL